MKKKTLALAALLLPLSFSLSALAIPARVILIRHGEKTLDSDENLSPQGYARAEALSGLFDKQPDLAQYGLPVALFAASPHEKAGSSHRAIETLTPLSAKLGLPIESSYESKAYQDLANEILSNPAYDGKTVMIAWTHPFLVDLAQALGSAPLNKWNKDVFNQIWIIDFHAGNSVTSVQVPEDLLPGDN